MTSELMYVPSSVSMYHTRQTEWLDTENAQSQPACARIKACSSSCTPACTAHIERISRFQISAKRRHIASRAEKGLLERGGVKRKIGDLIGGRARVYKASAICSQVVLAHHVTNDHGLHILPYEVHICLSGTPAAHTPEGLLHKPLHVRLDQG